jgi:dihydroorotate dehydrogenase (NAD+) catalytic subunit
MANMLETEFCGLKLRNPTVLASGILGINAALLKRAAKAGAGAVTTKSIGPREKGGHKNPSVLEWEHGLINAVGLPCAGCAEMEKELAGKMEGIEAPVIVSIYGSSVEEFEEVASTVVGLGPAMVEINISCPNTKKEGQVFGVSAESAAEVTAAVKEKAGKIPVMPKLTPQASNIADVARACEQAGANAICAINTLQGMVIDAEAKKPVLANKWGGISGPAIKPIALRCVYQIYEAVSIPILGVGGITNGLDAIEMMMAGATAIGIGSGVHYRNIGVFRLVQKEMLEWMHLHGVKSGEEIVGAAHD